MKFLLALSLSVYCVYIASTEPSPMYIALVWLIPLTLFVWYELICTDNFKFLDRFINNQKGRHK